MAITRSGIKYLDRYLILSSPSIYNGVTTVSKEGYVKKPFIHDYKIIRPRFNCKQDDLNNWLAEAHALNVKLSPPPLAIVKGDDSPLMRLTAAQQLPPKARNAAFFEKMFNRFGCSSQQIEYRGTEVSDITHRNWKEMKLFNFAEKPQGEDFGKRMQQYSESAERVVSQFYEHELNSPDQIIHVSCTGYESPSAVQKVVSKKEWGAETSTVHAYHMGCYAAFPAMNLASNRLARQNSDRRVDVVHTEMCTLHVEADNHSPEQLVIQSLFGDGFIKYSLSNEDDQALVGKTGLVVECFKERMVKGTHDAMTWKLSSWGLQMTLDKDVPGLIAQDLVPFCHDLAQAMGKNFDEIKEKAIFAIHPGGPKIVAAIQDLLRLESNQIRHSREILKKYGNMSSATVPHILAAITEDKTIPDGTPVISMAFGPGLTMYGCILVKKTL